MTATRSEEEAAAVAQVTECLFVRPDERKRKTVLRSMSSGCPDCSYSKQELARKTPNRLALDKLCKCV